MPYPPCKPYIRHRPDEDIRKQEQRHTDICRQKDVAQGEKHGHGDYGYHCRALPHPDGQQLVMDVVPVWQERVLAVAHPVQIDTHHIEAGDYERRVGQHEHVGHTGCHAVGKAPAHLQAEDAEHHADGQAARVAHEYLTSAFGVAEHVIIEERHEHAEGGEGEYGVDVFMRHQEYHSVEQHRHAAQPGGQAVDAVNQVDGVDDEHHGKHRKRPSRPCGYVIYKEQAVQVVNPHSGGNHHHPAGYLHHELRAVTDAYQVIGHAHKIEHQDGTETES